MFKALIKSRMSAMLHSISQTGKNSSKKSKSKGAIIGLSILFAVLIGYFIVVMGIMAYGLCYFAKNTGNNYVVFTLAVIISCGISIFGSIFVTKTQMFESRDNELLLSMPIPPRYILISRLIVLLLANYLLQSVILIPTMIIYGILIGYTLLGFIYALVVFLLLPFITLCVSCLIGWIVSEITSRIKKKTLVSVLAFVVFFSAYMLLCGSIGAFVGEGNVESIDLSGLKNTAFFYWAGSSISDGNSVNLLLFASCCIAPSILSFIILDKSFIRITTTKKTGSRIQYKGNKEKQRGAYGALLKKEIRRFFTSSSYIMNAGIGNIMTVLLAILICVGSVEVVDEIAKTNNDVLRFIPLGISAMILFIGSMNFVSAPSISLEDKTLWILQSSPIDPKDVLMAKINSHIIICTPLTVLSALILCVGLKVDFINSIFIVLLTVEAIVFMAYWGLLLGLKFPKFGWQNELVAIKQGFAVFGAMFGGMLINLLVMGIGVLGTFVSPILGLALMILPYAIGIFAIRSYLLNGGCKVFENLKK